MAEPPRKEKRAAASGPDARKIAARVIERVDSDGAYASAALDAELRKYPQLDQRERSLATELCYGALRTRGALTKRLERHATRGVQKDRAVLAHLLVAAYQILLLDSVPAFAAVDAAVGAIRGARGPKVAGFANAVLRKLAGEGQKLDGRAAALETVPTWLRQSLADAVGEEGARALVSAGSDSGPWENAASVRLVRDCRESWMGDGRDGSASPLAVRLRGHGDLRKLSGWAEGSFVIQEEGAQVVALSLGAKPGERVLDACAGRGLKSSLLAEQVGTDGEVWATDVHPSKLRALTDDFERLRLPAPRTAAVDWSKGVGEVPDEFDRVLVDAPCTGVGSLRRRPEIAQRLRKGDPARLSSLAESILRAAATRAKARGRVVFAVCSVLTAECEAVVERVADVLEPVPFDVELPRIEPGSTSFRLHPLVSGTDGYFVASFVRLG